MKRVAALVVVILALPLSVQARQRPGAEGGTSVPPVRQDVPPADQPARSTETVDASKLGVSLARIRRELGQAEAKEQSGGGPLRLEFTVEVYGTAPKINLLENFPLSGPMPYGGPTHREVLDVLTPQEYRSPVIPFSTIAYWAAQQLWNKSRKQRCEEELAEYKRLVMQGVAVAAPRCSQ